MSIQEKDQKILWGKAAGRCSMLDCRKRLVLEAAEKNPSKNILFGQNCHIVAEKEGGPRGKSILSIGERNRYPNLILLCANHHTIIDEDPGSWPVEKLHQIKADHEIWVETHLSDDIDDPSIEVYNNIVNSATEYLMLEYWDWVSDHAVRLLLSEEFVNGVDVFCSKVHRTIWQGKYQTLESAIKNLSERISLYTHHFLENAKLNENVKKAGQGFFVEDKWWKAEWRNDYDHYAEKSRRWAKKTTALLSNVIVALNEFANEVRNNLNPRYLLFQGKFVLNDSMGVINEMKSAIFMPEDYIEINDEK